MFTRLLRILFVCCVASLLPGCNRAEKPADVVADAPPEPELVPADVWRPDPDREELPPDRIYFTLTDHDWYARGEPLLHDGHAFSPTGMPIAASLSDMKRAGEYEGVEYYTRNDSEEPTVYVPVFHGYWQPFQADSTALGARLAAPVER
jgi:hypothetical protein